MKEKINVGLAWWQASQWERLKEISEDRENLEDTYEEWRKNASLAIRNLEAEGQNIKKVKINLEELIIWCNDESISVNSASRAEYSAYLLEKRSK